jgi:hypothetical protein
MAARGPAFPKKGRSPKSALDPKKRSPQAPPLHPHDLPREAGPFQADRTIICFFSFVKVGQRKNPGLFPPNPISRDKAPKRPVPAHLPLEVTPTIRRPASLSGPACPRSRVVQKVVINVIEHAIGAQMNEHHAGNLPYNQQPRGTLTARETSVGAILRMKLITLFIVVFHGASHEE